MKVKKILVSQPEPADLEKSPYKNLVTKYNVDITFFKFFEVVGLTASEFRKSRIHLTEYTAVIFNSKNSVDHFFRLAKELREVIPDTMKYFCSSEAIAHYLQNYIQYRKRKIFFGNQYFADLIEVLSKHRDEKFLFPCSDEKQTEYTKMLDKAKFKYTKATMYTSVPRDLKALPSSKLSRPGQRTGNHRRFRYFHPCRSQSRWHQTHHRCPHQSLPLHGYGHRKLHQRQRPGRSRHLPSLFPQKGHLTQRYHLHLWRNKETQIRLRQ